MCAVCKVSPDSVNVQRGFSRLPPKLSCPTDANSTELNEKVEHPVVIFMPEISKTHLGGTMRLGLRPTVFQKGSEWSLVRQLYGGNEIIWERHRHRWEINPEYVERIEAKGLHFVGRDGRGERMQVAELKRKSGRDEENRVHRSSGTNELLGSFFHLFGNRRLGAPILCRHASASRVLHTTTQPFSGLPWLRRCFGRRS